jgi:hypothetical protein
MELSSYSELRKLNVLHNVPVWELSQHFIGLPSICHCFPFEEILIFAHILFYAVLQRIW